MLGGDASIPLHMRSRRSLLLILAMTLLALAGPSAAVAQEGAATTPAPAADPAAAPGIDDGAIAAAADRPARATEAKDAPVALVLLAVLAGLTALAAVAWALARALAYEPRWLAPTRHATAEAGWRASAGWAEFVDWVRLGR